ncbi:hypothetical protein F7734_16550 [Scytonema sp. UIC 10036]|uniref:hypothetical protein n=1 Tax=Scytonema sp. UIC 10036 TaxID=2304196 RepID=UPI0012DA05D0|nr:hypothetical protein [Scytonema sp. UIC 10036]MUG93920.1 hypothetical protein [Scytonema sp. UIC 10036]
MTDVFKALKSANFLVDANGQRVAVQLSMAAWEILLDWVENQEDAAIVKAAIPKLKELRSGSESREWIDWDAVKEQWDED